MPRSRKTSNKICSVGIEFPLDELDFITLDERRALSDYEMVVFCPNFDLAEDEMYNGLTLVDHDDASILHADYAHWSQELQTALRLGKPIILVACAPKNYYYRTGEKRHTGSGRTARVTNVVQPSNTYECVRDIPVTPVAVKGRRLSPAPAAAQFPRLTKLFVDQNYYEAVVDLAQHPILQLPDGSGRCGTFASVSFSNLIVVPAIDQSEWTERRHGDEGDQTEYWTNAAIKFARQFRGVIDEVQIATKLGVGETKPQWVLDGEFRSNRQIERDKMAERLRSEREKLDSEISELMEANAADDRWLELLFGTGPRLEARVIEALGVLGIEAVEYSDDTHQFDAVFEIDGVRFIGECEGRDNKAIEIGKLSQLERCIAEDLAIREGEAFAEGVLFGNSHRLHKPSDRGQPFTERVLKAAAQRGTRLVATVDLFESVLAVSNGAGDEYKMRCQQAILNGKGGRVSFPGPPQ